ncbi:MAG: class I SAM-dependent methyltransferase [Actinobacteria bacterium]|nr:class I SAM-dependent methyltransferase [Actinomycetota bacterium]
MNELPQTWHYGVVARWWAEFNVSGPEIAYFRQFIEDDGQPALDVACGTGRLLVPYLRAGLDVDGCDISTDMLALCREAAEREGLSPTLYAQAMHELDLPRRYRTILVCGGFGLGGTREQDLEALRRLHDHLEPGGVLVLDNEVPYTDTWLWPRWLAGARDDLPRPWPAPGERRKGSDGAEYELRTRLIAFDPLEQRVMLEMLGEMWRDQELVESGTHVLTMTLYFKNELLLMLERAGFADVTVRGDYTDHEPTADTEFVVFIARKL